MAAPVDPAAPLASVRARDVDVRHFVIRADSINEKDRTVDLAFSSETPVERYFGNEVLDHGPGGCDLSALNDGAPLLKDHDETQQIGVIVPGSAKIDSDRTGRCTARFANSPLGQQEFQDVKDGIRSKISCGYERTEGALQSTADGVSTYRFKWKPQEVSTVAIPADPSVGVGRALDTANAKEIPITRSAPTPEKTTMAATANEEPKIDVVAERNTAATAERTRCNEIRAIAKKFKCEDAGDTFITEGKSVDEFRAQILEGRGAQKVELQDPNIGLDKRELKRYSIVRALNLLANGRQLDGLEKEASDAVGKRMGKEAVGFYIPHDVQSVSLAESRGFNRATTRALAAEIASAGGYTIQENVLAGSMIELLRNKMVLNTLGCTMLSGLVGNVAIPKQTGGAIAYWLPENGDVPESDQSFGQLALTPKRLAAQTAYGKGLLAQSSLDVEAFVRGDLSKIIALAKDAAGIAGTGADGQPLGIFTTTGVSATTFGGPVSFGQLVDMETAVATLNADVGSLNYLTTPGVRGKLKQRPELANTIGNAIWRNNEVNGYNAAATNQVPGNRVCYGNFADLILADWDGMDVVVDPYTLAGKNQVRIVVNLMTDNGVRHSFSFVVSTDAGNL